MARPSRSPQEYVRAIDPPARLPLELAFHAGRKTVDALCSGIARPGDRAGRRVIFVSPRHGAGTTTIATSCALGLARKVRVDVALIEANTYTPGMAAYLGIPLGPGLTDYLDGHATQEQAVRNSQVPGLYVLSAGTPRHPIEGELATRHFRELMQAFSREHRYAVIDAPPIVDHPDARILFEFADTAVLVLQAGRTSTHEARSALRLIEDTGVEILGTILNRFQTDMPFGIGGEGWT